MSNVEIEDDDDEDAEKLEEVQANWPIEETAFGAEGLESLPSFQDLLSTIATRDKELAHLQEKLNEGDDVLSPAINLAEGENNVQTAAFQRAPGDTLQRARRERFREKKVRDPGMRKAAFQTECSGIRPAV
ncbi:MAG: hypothetical protein BJ554DRAFT_3047 [Olpidium bornovanus]|uniref:Uncharacterized protein n=1 Tax=Olpidium bornovanus TaxID=278681 RepID=A0A8H7ZPE0_9FUNG|nr:MAG: hypothetical protein BJ554DRAFT_3047 [Olpidium bornovanus]